MDPEFSTFRPFRVLQGGPSRWTRNSTLWTMGTGIDSTLKVTTLYLSFRYLDLVLCTVDHLVMFGKSSLEWSEGNRDRFIIRVLTNC